MKAICVDCDCPREINQYGSCTICSSQSTIVIGSSLYIAGAILRRIQESIDSEREEKKFKRKLRKAS